MEIFRCSLCFDDIINEKAVMTSVCTCTVKYHQECLTTLHNHGYDCPICRKKNSTIHVDHDNIINEKIIQFMEYIYLALLDEPTFITLVLYFIVCSNFTLCILLPTLIWKKVIPIIYNSNFVQELVIFL